MGTQDKKEKKDKKVVSKKRKRERRISQKTNTDQSAVLPTHPSKKRNQLKLPTISKKDRKKQKPMTPPQQSFSVNNSGGRGNQRSPRFRLNRGRSRGRGQYNGNRRNYSSQNHGPRYQNRGNQQGQGSGSRSNNPKYQNTLPSPNQSGSFSKKNQRGAGKKRKNVEVKDPV